MPRPFSYDLRKRLVDRTANGESRRAAANALDVSASFSVKLVARYEQTGTLEAAPMGRPKGTGKLDAFRDFLIGAVEAKPDITMPELTERLASAHNVSVNPASLSRFLCKAGFTYKKNAAGLGTRSIGCAQSTSHLD